MRPGCNRCFAPAENGLYGAVQLNALSGVGRQPLINSIAANLRYDQTGQDCQNDQNDRQHDTHHAVRRPATSDR